MEDSSARACSGERPGSGPFGVSGRLSRSCGARLAIFSRLGRPPLPTPVACPPPSPAALKGDRSVGAGAPEDDGAAPGGGAARDRAGVPEGPPPPPPPGRGALPPPPPPQAPPPKGPPAPRRPPPR